MGGVHAIWSDNFENFRFSGKTPRKTELTSDNRIQGHILKKHF